MKNPLTDLIWNDFTKAKELSKTLKCSEVNEVLLYSFIQTTYNKGANDCLNYLHDHGMLKEEIDEN